MSARTFDINKTKKYGNVTVINNELGIAVVLHMTEVVVYSESLNKIYLSSGGWKTPTTKLAINNALRQLETLTGQEFPTLVQVNGKWFLDSFDKSGFKRIDFQDGMELAVYPLLQALA
jgi:hypothetical protein